MVEFIKTHSKQYLVKMRATTINALVALKTSIDARVTNKIDLYSISPLDVGGSIDDTINTITNGETDFLEDKCVIPTNFSLTIDNFGNIIIMTP
jgi:hypothetical protein